MDLTTNPWYLPFFVFISDLHLSALRSLPKPLVPAIYASCLGLILLRRGRYLYPRSLHYMPAFGTTVVCITVRTILLHQIPRRPQVGDPSGDQRSLQRFFVSDSCDRAQDPVKGHPRPMIESVGEKLPTAHKPPNPTNFYCTKCKITLEPCGKMDSMICG